jgi:hypothetical protein
MLPAFRTVLRGGALALSTLVVVGCTSPPADGVSAREGAARQADGRRVDGQPDRAQLVAFGEPFQTSAGQIFVLKVQDEYRVIRCIPDGPIAGCYEDVLSVSNDKVDWNAWMSVGDVPGLRVAFVSPTAIALFQGPVDESAELPPPK